MTNSTSNSTQNENEVWINQVELIENGTDILNITDTEGHNVTDSVSEGRIKKKKTSWLQKAWSWG